MANEVVRFNSDTQFGYQYLKGLVDAAMAHTSETATWQYSPSGANTPSLVNQGNELMNHLETAYNKVLSCSSNYRSSHFSSNKASHQSGNNGNNSVCSSSNYSTVRSYNA